ncbi:3-methyl-2-oxobutanoate hydroxymethyltransferase [Fimbriimonas ginsengisoli]|uniref:3-methyl-2-oxobutanoate hydroxymethyltransferase n=1 Tax=Fimbriimonas ginsengisoli Gsoil 348 TaxID=661478 RepID=A0A068NY03_FIMGI|nr:3-methyl-2-oxobutanoate hydroxymethyltransferase [Fimbriimonas ginsengisoli]AIE87715.1 3-methyl-2-oxobutanoate hydroxymethyltransferase [Fimbriimonas ginsengisoli Gsoil 348]
MSERVTVPHIRAMREKGRRVVCVTAYDALFGALADAAGVDLVLVGDSVGNVLLGYPTTVPVTLEDMLHHTRATRAGVKRALLVSDLPFGSFQVSVSDAVGSAVALMKAGAEAVKLEGDYTEQIEACVRAGIPVMGHLGMTPQSVNLFGGHRVQGKGSKGESIIDTAKRLEDAGAFSMVLELIPAELAERITEAVSIPTIGIGAGAGCSGQIQVLYDVLGLSAGSFRHARAFVHGSDCLLDGLRSYTEVVRDGSFPTSENSF